MRYSSPTYNSSATQATGHSNFFAEDFYVKEVLRKKISLRENLYLVQDHLGNVRVVLTDEQQQNNYPPASMETAQATTEEALYSNVNTTRNDFPTGYPTNDTYTKPNAKVANTNGSGNKIAP